MGERNARSSGTHTQRIKALNWSSSISELQYPGSVTQRDSGQCSSVVWLAMFGALLRRSGGSGAAARARRAAGAELQRTAQPKDLTRKESRGAQSDDKVAGQHGARRWGREHAAESAALAPSSVCLASFRIIGDQWAHWWCELLRGGCEWKEAQPGNEAVQRQQCQRCQQWQATRQPTGTGTQATAAQEVAHPCAGRWIHAARDELQWQLGNIG